MNTVRLDTSWDVPLDELNGHLRAAGVEPVTSSRDGTCDLDLRMMRMDALRGIVRQARADAPPVQEWLTASESLALNDDGSQAAREKADSFWLRLSQIVHGSLALVMLGDLAEIPFFIELLRHQPAGHLVEMADTVLRHYVDPSHELDAPRLLQAADKWWKRLLSNEHSEGCR